MCPGRPPTRSRMSRALRAPPRRPEAIATGSRLPCTARSSPTSFQASSMGMRQSTPITSPPALGQEREQERVAGGEVDGGHARLLQPLEEPPHVREDVPLVVVGAQRLPAQESKTCTTAAPGLVLGDPELRHVVGPEAGEAVPRLGLAPHERLRLVQVAGAGARDQVGAEGEGRADEAEHRHVEPATPGAGSGRGCSPSPRADRTASAGRRPTASRCAAVTTGPTPGRISTSNPAPKNGVERSL